MAIMRRKQANEQYLEDRRSHFQDGTKISFRNAWILSTGVCLGLFIIGFLIAATIILALIPIYLPAKTVDMSSKYQFVCFDLCDCSQEKLFLSLQISDKSD